jgi:hypothetical protein
MLLLLLHYIEYTMIDRLDNTTASIKILSFFKFHSAPENGENNKRMLSELMRIESEKIRDPPCVHNIRHNTQRQQQDSDCCQLTF